MITDHGSLVFRAGEASECFADPWDSGLAGLIYASPADVQRVGCAADRVVEALTAEVEEYSRWSEGDCWGYIVERFAEGCWDEVDSCWGFIGDEYAQTEALDVLRSYL